MLQNLDLELLHNLVVTPSGQELIKYLNSRIATLQHKLCYSADLGDKNSYEIRGGFKELEALLTKIETIDKEV